jgi:hypothetical protein
MKRAELEALGLTKEQIDLIMSMNGNDIEHTKETLNEQIKMLTSQLSERDKQLETLKESAAGSEELQRQIDELNATNKQIASEYKAKLHEFKLDAAIDKALTEAGSRNNVAVRALLGDFSKAKIDDETGAVEGLADKIAELQAGENTAFMFAGDPAPIQQDPDAGVQPTPDVGAGAAANANHFVGFQPGSGEAGNGGMPDTSKMTYSEMVAYQQAHPDFKI